jgi:trans-2-enoyl-CoA reductase
MIIKDNIGREIVKMNENGDIAIARFPDMSEELKKIVSEMYSELTGEEIGIVKDYLDYKNEIEEFCV